MLRFTIRDVLWLTLVVGLAVGWWVDRGKVARQCSAAIAGILRQQDETARQQEAAAHWQNLAHSLADELTGVGWTVEIDEPPLGWVAPPGIEPVLYSDVP